MAKGKRPVVLETKNDISHEYTKVVKASEEGTYEVISIRDRYCGFSVQKSSNPEQ
jgi:nucleoporin POM152